MRYCLLIVALALQFGCMAFDDDSYYEPVCPCRSGVAMQATGEPPLAGAPGVGMPRVVTTAAAPVAVPTAEPPR